MRQIHKALQEVFDEPTRRGIAKAFLYLFRNQPLITTTIATSANSYFVGAGTALYLVDGVTVSIPTTTQFNPTGATVPNAGNNIGVGGFSIDKFGNAYSFGSGQTWASISSIIWPTPPDSKDGTLVTAYWIVTNGSAGNYVPGTTATNTASLAWQFVYEVDGIYQMNNFGQV